ncbi:hypothetical protein [Serratia marcescens]|uniref:hypothetical protein n=1 Tax=Serratia marcescens TaxID=615 RepID=UPI003AAFB65D
MNGFPVLLYDAVMPGKHDHISEYLIVNPFDGLPYTEGAVGMYCLSTKMLDPLTNYANPEQPLLKVGNPIGTPLGFRFADGNYFDTGILATKNMTFITIGLAQDLTKDVWFISNYKGSPKPSFSTLLRKDKQVASYSQLNGGLGDVVHFYGDVVPQDQHIIATGRFNSAAMYAGAYNPVAHRILESKRDGTVEFESDLSLRLGQRYVTGNGEPLICASFVFDHDINTIALQDNCAWLREEWGPKFGIWA